MSVMYLCTAFSSESQQCPQPPAPQTLDAVVANDGRDELAGSPNLRSGSDMVKVEGIGTVPGRQPGGLPSQGYSKYQKLLPPRFQRQQQVSACRGSSLGLVPSGCVRCLASHF